MHPYPKIKDLEMMLVLLKLSEVVVLRLPLLVSINFNIEFFLQEKFNVKIPVSHILSGIYPPPHMRHSSLLTPIPATFEE